ncbi:hypothetical protein GGR52DRAFT_203016 [Hypoxylon sp. FL1284]|nr:hypothetical protein GGR52DRAFT_203016 [Hypoxylon sp. FL1284]
MLVTTLKAAVPAAILLLAGRAAAKTDLSGCVSSETVAYGGASLVWYVPDTGEICDFIDCGGGRAPPKTTVPGCAAYSGTATYSPSFLPGFGADATSSAVASGTDSSPAASSASVASSTAAGSADASSATSVQSDASMITSAPSTSAMQTSSAAAAGSSGASSASNGMSSSSSAGSSGAAESSSSARASNVSQAAAVPTAAVKGAVGVVVGFAAGVAMM